MELPVPAVGSTQSEAETQAALRRVAMMIARAEPCDAVLRAVTAQAARQFEPATADVIRYEPDGRTTLVAHGTQGAPGAGWGSQLPAGLTTTVLRTGRFISASVGSRFAAAMPVRVDDLLWGLVAVGSGRALPPDAEQRLGELAELVATAVTNEQRNAELSASRARLVAASDEARRQIERDLHDGAQQLVIALVLRLQLVAETPALLPEIRTEIEDVAAELTGILDDLRELSRGIHPEILSEGGLRPALRALARRSTVPVVMDLRIHSRLPEPVEVGAYYMVSEVLANALKHGRASSVEVAAGTSGGALHVQVRDDGVGGADLAGGLRPGRAPGPDRGAGRDLRRGQPARRRHDRALPPPHPGGAGLRRVLSATRGARAPAPPPPPGPRRARCGPGPAGRPGPGRARGAAPR